MINGKKFLMINRLKFSNVPQYLSIRNPSFRIRFIIIYFFWIWILAVQLLKFSFIFHRLVYLIYSIEGSMRCLYLHTNINSSKLSSFIRIIYEVVFIFIGTHLFHECCKKQEITFYFHDVKL